MRALAFPLLLLLLAVRNATNCESNRISSWDSHEGSHFVGTFDHCLCREYDSGYAICYNPENCTRFPRTFKTGMKRFRLATTGVENITVGDLRNMGAIERLEIEANKQLKRIESGSFAEMWRLKSLSIAYNPNLYRFEDDVFAGLGNLENLSIRRNGFEDIGDFSLSLRAEFMPKLRRLELHELRCPVVGKNDFGNLNGSSLEELILSDSQVEYIHPEALLPLRKLKVLNLGQNLINTTNLIEVLEQLIRANITLRTLNLFGWGFKKSVPRDLMEVVSKSKLKELILSKNQFDVITIDTFPRMLHLEILRLNDVLLSYFTSDAFSQLPQLKCLDLSQNKFLSIPPTIEASNLEELDLSREARYFDLDNYTFVNMTGLRKLDLSSNNIRKISNGSFADLINLTHLNLKDSTIFYIDSRSFNPLKRLRFLSLERNPFPNRTSCSEIFEGLEQLETLELGSCDIRFLKPDIFKDLKSLRRLDLRGNNLKVIPPAVFYPLPKLENVDLSGNSLSVWRDGLFGRNPRMKVLKVSANKLAYFTKAMLEDIAGLDALDASENPYNCECKSFRNFSHFNRSIVELFRRNETKTRCVYPDKFADHTLVDYLEKIYEGEECTMTIWDTLADYLIPIVILLVITMVSAIVFYVYRWHIRYWIFLTKLYITRRSQFRRSVSLEAHDNYLYDAFVSYSSEDRNFVVRLVAMLENYEPFLKLCVDERDFEVGTFISESVLDCLSRSRKTLLVISNSYIKSQWCRWEAQVAENHRLFFKNEYAECVDESIIMIKLGTISQHDMSPMLKYLMKTRIYLEWDSEETKQKQFWDKLRNALAPPPPPYSISKKVEGVVEEVTVGTKI